MKYPWKNLLPRYLILIVFMLVVLVPIWGMFTSAFKTSTEVMEGPFSLPSDWSLYNFEQAWRVGRFNIFFKNSVIVATAVVISSVFLSTLSGYAFGALPLPGKSWLYPLILIGYMVPFEAVIIPLYNLMDTFGITDTLWALILPQVGLSVSFGTMWMSSFFENTPGELTDAATIDGCSRWQTLWYILWPIAKPAVTTLVVLIFMWTWNEFLLALSWCKMKPCVPCQWVWLSSRASTLPIFPSWQPGDYRRFTDHPDLCPLPTLLHPRYARRRSKRLILLSKQISIPKTTA